jgi:hypothetical protein
MSGQHHAPAALPPGKQPPITIEEEAEWAPESVWLLSRIEKFSTSRDRGGREADRSPPSTAEVNIGGAIFPLPHASSWRDA